jgi:hypothetical protein
VLAQSDPEIHGDPNDQENFGASLAAGNLGKNSHADLAVGVPNDWIETTQRAGSVNVLYGSTTGITTMGNQRWTQDSAGIAGAAEDPDHFGSALAVADSGRSTRGDLAVSAPCEEIAGAVYARGVHVIFGTKTGLSATGDQFWSQNSTGVADKAEQVEAFGLAMTGANFGKSRRADLAISVSETIGGHPAPVRSRSSTGRTRAFAPREASGGPRRAPASTRVRRTTTNSGGRSAPATSGAARMRTLPSAFPSRASTSSQPRAPSRSSTEPPTACACGTMTSWFG